VLTERRIKEIASLRRGRNREEQNALIVEGLRSVRAALDGNAEIVDLIATNDAADERVCEEVKRRGGRVFEVSARRMKKMSDVRVSQGILAVCRRPIADASELLNRSSVLLLDSVQDPGNVGTLVRTAGWFGLDGILAGPGTADFFNPKVVRSSMGGIWDVALAGASDLSIWMDTFRGLGGRIYAADMSGPSLQTYEFRHPSALVIGSEAHGISEPVRAFVDESIYIPGTNGSRATESLNAAVAGALIISRWAPSSR
jgi:RNA methyltransferase, TrmH family